MLQWLVNLRDILIENSLLDLTERDTGAMTFAPTKICKSIKLIDLMPFARGGFAVLYRAHLQLEDGSGVRPVAVKVPEKWNITHTDGIDGYGKALIRWKREIAGGQFISHPNIIPVLGYCDNPDPEFKEFQGIILPFCANGNAREYIGKHVEADRLHIIILVCSALFALHTNAFPVVHGDIKGINILVDDRGDPLLADFGLSRICETKGFTTRTIMGSTRWMPPELLRESGNGTQTPEDPIIRTTKASDIWAFGMTILELLTGKVPYAEYTDLGMALGVLNNCARPRRPIGSQISEAIWTLLEHCWAEEPSERPDARHVGLVLDLIYGLGRDIFGVPDVLLILNSQLDSIYPQPTLPDSSHTRSASLPYACKWLHCSQAFANIDGCATHECDEFNLRRAAASL